MTTQDTSRRRPDHIIWQVIGEGDAAKWVRVGAGWSNRDQKGVSLKFDSFPLTGRIQVRAVSEADEARANGGQS
ncbi:hypothetical protein J2Y55_002120 [Bosea sp. BE125]|uniref:hypothetical protein n=1 Tax=Bosea sp. BE125 TaxID=2817909 RepID=UPI002858C064|nr:hypothetical protein [Bosea sp. BE125]MDR6871112.1 hypothetical protein [Bosea sp. BE125]